MTTQLTQIVNTIEANKERADELADEVTERGEVEDAFKFGAQLHVQIADWVSDASGRIASEIEDDYDVRHSRTVPKGGKRDLDAPASEHTELVFEP